MTKMTLKLQTLGKLFPLQTYDDRAVGELFGIALDASGVLESEMLKEFSHGGYKPHRSPNVAWPLACREGRGNRQDSDRQHGVE